MKLIRAKDVKITTSTQKYTIVLGGGQSAWEFIYEEVEHHGEAPAPKNSAKATLVIQEIYKNECFSDSNPGKRGYFSDTIILKSDGQVVRQSDKIGYSPAIDGFKEMDESTQAEIATRLSVEAQALLKHGLEGYVEL